VNLSEWIPKWIQCIHLFGHARQIGANDCGCSAVMPIPQFLILTQHLVLVEQNPFTLPLLFFLPRWDIDQWVVGIKAGLTDKMGWIPPLSLSAEFGDDGLPKHLWNGLPLHRMRLPLRHWSSKPALKYYPGYNPPDLDGGVGVSYLADIRRVLKTTAQRTCMNPGDAYQVRDLDLWRADRALLSLRLTQIL